MARYGALVVTGSKLYAAKLGAKLLRPKERTCPRAELAKRMHALRGFETGASNSDLWNRVGDELPEWAHSGVVSPASVDRVHGCLTQLDPRKAGDQAQREAARTELRTILDDLYYVLISSDPLTREFREVVRIRRHARAARRTKGLSSGAVLGS